MKKMMKLLLALCLTFTLVACSSGENEESEEIAEASNRLEAVQQKGVLTVATEPYFAPYEFIDPSKSGDDMYLGLDIELMKAIAGKIGVDLEIVPLDYTAVLSGITTGTYDMAISAIAYSPERSENMNLSDVYQESDTGYGFIVREEDKDKYNSIEDLKDAVVATQSGSVQEGIFNSDVTENGCKEVKLFAQMTDCYLAVQEGRADVCICSTDSAQLYADANGGLFVPEFRFDVDPNMNGVVVACPKEDTDELMAIVNEVIKEKMADGSIEKWFEEASEQCKELGIE